MYLSLYDVSKVPFDMKPSFSEIYINNFIGYDSVAPSDAPCKVR